MTVCVPELDSGFNPLVWCPMMIKLKERNQFYSSTNTGEENNLVTALNDQNFRGSLKKAYLNKSMSLPVHAQFPGTPQSDEDDSDDTDL